MSHRPRRALMLGICSGLVLALLGAGTAMAGTPRVFAQTNSASGIVVPDAVPVGVAAR